MKPAVTSLEEATGDVKSDEIQSFVETCRNYEKICREYNHIMRQIKVTTKIVTKKNNCCLSKKKERTAYHCNYKLGPIWKI